MSDKMYVKEAVFHKFVRKVIELTNDGWVEDDSDKKYPKQFGGFFTINMIKPDALDGVIQNDPEPPVETQDNPEKQTARRGRKASVDKV